MPLDPQQVFRAMRSAYRHGVLDKFMAIQGEAIMGVIEETGLNMGDLLNKMDEASPETVMKIDRLLERSGPMLGLAENDNLMKMTSRLLDVAFVRRLMIEGMKRSLTKTVTGQAPPSIAERVKAFAAKTS